MVLNSEALGVVFVAGGEWVKDYGFGLHQLHLRSPEGTQGFVKEVDLVEIVGGGLDIFVREGEHLEVQWLSIFHYFQQGRQRINYRFLILYHLIL